MKTSELRRGNIINFTENDELAIVEEIDANGVKVDAGKELVWIEIWEFNPIQLNAEWLLKLGFIPCTSPFNDKLAWVIGEDANRIIWCTNNLFKPLPDGFIRITYDEYPAGKYLCEYVHQLQNACAILRGEELTIKP